MKQSTMLKRLFVLFITFMKIGALTFGGGYAMIPIIEEEVSKKRKWVSSIEILDIIAISESTPGPIAVNTATYIGYKVAGIWGSILATLGLAIPSFVIIYIISFFYKDFISWKVVSSIFQGLKIGVILLLIKALIRLSKGLKINGISVILFTVSLIVMLLASIFDINFKYFSLCLILLGIVVGLIVTKVTIKKGNK